MLTGYQCEVVAALGEGEFLCLDCLALDYSQLAIEKWERGLTTAIPEEIQPIIRYSLDELNSERTYEAAEERVRDFEFDHPELAKTLGVYDRPNVVAVGHNSLSEPADRNRWRIIDRIAEHLGETYEECCGSCGKHLG